MARRGSAPAPSKGVDVILDAAERVVQRDGMGRLTLQAVAKAAGLSKAGLLHHFPSKDAMIAAMVRRHVSEWLGEFERMHSRLSAAGDPRPAVNALASTCLSGTESWTEAERARNRVMVAALVHDEKQVEPLREVYRRVAAAVAKDRLPEGVGEVIHLAVHGLWFQWIFGMGEISGGRLRRIRAALGVSGVAKGSRGGRARERGAG